MRPAALAVLLPMLAASAAAQPPVGAWFRYAYEQRMVAGAGAYEGYTESTRARARYDVLRVEGGLVYVQARYAWRYSSPERTDSGEEDRTVTFDLTVRRYRSSRTDVSDYDSEIAVDLAAWMWIPPDVEVGSTVQILERDFVVRSKDERVVVAGAPREAILLETTATGRREDAYGRLTTRITDRYWYDAPTGMFLREEHEEHATGSLDGELAEFSLLTTIEVIDASYAPATDPPPPDDYREAPPDELDRPRGPSAAMVVALVGAGLGGIVLLVLLAGRRRRRKSGGRTAEGEAFRVEPLRRGAAVPSGLSPVFDPFLPRLVGVALASGQKVSVARTAAGAAIGLGLSDHDAKVATIFARDSDVCEVLRTELGETELFSEVRHPALASVKAVGLDSPAEAYNVYETYEVLELRERPADLGYDAELVSRMGDEHRKGVLDLLSKCYGLPCERWLDASLAAGDVAWVAHEEERVIGVAMATHVGADARLHSLTVAEEQRNRGIGTALYRARLRALFDLGATRIVTECATWNLAALEIARAHGFTKVGTMYVESARSERLERRFVRR